MVYLDLGKPDRALEYHKKALKMFVKIKDKIGEANARGNIGNVYKDLGKLEDALEYLEESLKIHRETKCRIGEASALASIGIILNKMEKREEALRFLNEASDIFENIGAKMQADITSNHILEIVLD